VDAFGSQNYQTFNVKFAPTVNETLQAATLQKFWDIIQEYSDVVMGGMVMEFADEWWKGDYPYSSFNQESCPNLRYDQHNYCGSLIGNDTFLHEEWLGIFDQRQAIYMFSQNLYCVYPRLAYYTIASWWTTHNISQTNYDQQFCAMVGLHYSIAYGIAPLAFLIVLILIIFLRFTCWARKIQQQQKKRRSVAVLLAEQEEKEKRWCRINQNFKREN